MEQAALSHCGFSIPGGFQGAGQPDLLEGISACVSGVEAR